MTREHHDHARAGLAALDDALPIAIASWLAKSPHPRNFGSGERGKHLLEASIRGGEIRRRRDHSFIPPNRRNRWSDLRLQTEGLAGSARHPTPPSISVNASQRKYLMISGERSTVAWRKTVDRRR